MRRSAARATMALPRRRIDARSPPVLSGGRGGPNFAAGVAHTRSRNAGSFELRALPRAPRHNQEFTTR